MISIEPGTTATGRRTFPIAYRLEFLRQWDQCRERGAKTRLLRENKLTSATVRRWIEARRRGEWEESMSRAAKPGRDAAAASVDRAELARLRVENEQLRRKVSQAEAAQEILGKAFELLQGINQSSSPDPQIPPALMSATEYADWLKRLRL
ncbi:hypothetical protein MLP_20870 [Microlunatus phosphovorus NM-1]|uniref:Transposase n=1 Tax=Microlunatus phosphovorus (strain ATCC 700054 / DSM 10555 / JCM 9379 / NBRC 101784 / NCIMB 13414 / VKM Ac-1990 / NM-1) TaxID=1032480 RepID=F5XDS8_MICPN|nr:hypothetical protein [Microlunatus phosphovorus]BAK35101.1 hypothetical protein MLP_20870 [Microlunatus phosphovorus NM-1]